MDEECKKFATQIYFSVLNVEKRKKEWEDTMEFYAKIPEERFTETDKQDIRHIYDLKRKYWEDSQDALKEKLQEFVECECEKKKGD